MFHDLKPTKVGHIAGKVIDMNWEHFAHCAKSFK